MSESVTSLHHDLSLFLSEAYRTASVVHQIQLTRHGHGGSPAVYALRRRPSAAVVYNGAGRPRLSRPSRFSTAVAAGASSTRRCPPGHGLAVLCTGRQCGIVPQ